jgi:hypothetical protein
MWGRPPLHPTWWALALVIGCGGAPAREANEGFRRIQKHEAELELGARKLRDADACAESQVVAEREVCAPAAALCSVADELGDADARARCGAADDACRGARGRAQQRCATPASP